MICMAQERFGAWANFDFNREKEMTQTLKDKVINHFAFVNARRKDRVSR